MRVNMYWRVTAIAFLAAGMLPACIAFAQIIGTSCCTSAPRFAMKVMDSLDKRGEEPFDDEAEWLFAQLETVDRRKLDAVGAALEGYCAPSCSTRFAVAKAVVAALISERNRLDERSFRLADRWLQIFYVLIVLLGTAAAILFGRVEVGRERTLRALLQKLTSQEQVAHQGTAGNASMPASPFQETNR